MMNSNINKPVINRPFEKEYTIHTSRSSGPGGQHVNKTETKVEIRFHIESSLLLTEEEKTILKEKLKRRISSEGFLLVFAQERRSQIMNKQLAEKRFYQYIQNALKPRKKRIPTKPSKEALEKRMTAKKIKSEKKIQRVKIKLQKEE